MIYVYFQFQFTLLIYFYGSSLMGSCNYSKVMSLLIFSQGFLFLYLFGDFYKQTYVKSKKGKIFFSYSEIIHPNLQNCYIKNQNGWKIGQILPRIFLGTTNWSMAMNQSWSSTWLLCIPLNHYFCFILNSHMALNVSTNSLFCGLLILKFGFCCLMHLILLSCYQ